jgi:ubiquinone/menaquinone biosynthesis C-methylase UbiE
MSRIPGCRVVGLDINMTELQQAARVFGNSSKLKFIYGDIRHQVMEDLKFDIVVFAASIQYFPSCPEIVRLIQGRLNKGGEIHILDTILYEDGQLQAARKRSSDYFLSMGQPEMASYYFHHGVDGLMSLNPRILRDPRTMRNRLFSKNPFFWVCIHKEMIG